MVLRIPIGQDAWDTRRSSDVSVMVILWKRSHRMSSRTPKLSPNSPQHRPEKPTRVPLAEVQGISCSSNSLVKTFLV